MESLGPRSYGLTKVALLGHVAPVTEANEALRKHRHDLGHEDHGAKLAEGTTRGIQILLGVWIALSFGLVVYALIDGSQVDEVPAHSSAGAPR